ncbi:MAG TPA: ABC transporter permease [Actinomycetota bacterium]|nr:ABC transporter permease [Actinomycetota bacterium]
MNRVRALAVRIARTFRHDRRTLGLLVITPLVVMILIGYMVGDSGKEPLRVGVVTPPPSPGGGAAPALVFAQALRQQAGLSVADVSDADAGRAQVEGGELDGLIVTEAGPPGSSSALPPVTVVVPGVDVQVESPIVRAASLASAIAQGTPVNGDVPGLVVERVTLRENVRPTTISYAAPAMITVFAFLFTFMLTSVSFLRERQSGTLERLLASPIRTQEILGGYMLGFLPFAMIQALIVLGYATLVLHAQVSGPVSLVFAVLILLVLGVVNLGVALSFEARNELQVIQFIPLVLLPQVFLSGLFWPVRTLWPPLQWLAKLFPMTYAVRALREVMLAGVGLSAIAGELAALAVFALAMMGFGVAALRRLRA